MKFLIIFSILFSQVAFSQSVEWASSVISVSSEFVNQSAPGAFKAEQALGEPSIFIYGNSTMTAWTPFMASSANPEHITVGFTNAINVRQLIVSESKTSGSISSIWLYDAEGNEYKVYSSTTLTPTKEGLFTHLVPLTPYQVTSLKIEFTTAWVRDFINVDAIGISTTDQLFVRKINEVSATLFTEAAERLPDEINSPASELMPVISPDGNTLYFTRQGHAGNTGNSQMQDIWFSTRDKATGKFSQALNIGAPLNTKENNTLCSISPDGQTAMLLNVYKADGSMAMGISKTQRGYSTWSFPQEIKMDKFYNRSMYGEYHLNADNKTLVMAIQRDDAIGSKDMYVSFVKEDGTWTEPLHLGNDINTAEGETSPFLAPDRKTIYFASSGLPGYGGRDLFMTTRLDDSWTKWSKPINLGSKINTSGFNAFFEVPASGEYAYFTSNNGADFKEDIYRIKLPLELRPSPVVLVRGVVYNAKTKKPLNATILYESYDTRKVLGSATSGSGTGDYQIVLPAGSSYGFLAEAKGYASLNENIDLKKLTAYQEIKRDLYLYPLEKGQVIRLNNVFFDVDKYSFRSETYLELDRIVKLLQENTTLKIQVAGHTDNQGDVAHNQVLSNNRAKAVYEYLVSKNVPIDRLSYKGYGVSKPVQPNTTVAGRQQNRRVELIVLEN